MGVWGSGLYAGDFAKDLCAAIRAVSRLPYDGSRLLEILRGIEPTAADNQDAEDHTTFWLVVADGFARRGIDCPSVRQAAIRIIDEGSDIASLSKLGMTQADLGKRQKMLLELRARLTTALEGVRRAPVLKKPQPLLMGVGDVFIYPTSSGKCINPYLRSEDSVPGWKQDGWGAAIIVDCGRAFDFLAWYRPVTVASAMGASPSADFLQTQRSWILRKPGTCSALHFKRLELEKRATLAIDSDRLGRSFPTMPSGTYQAVNDISIANELSVAPSMNFRLTPYARISNLQDILISTQSEDRPGFSRGTVLTRDQEPFANG